MSFSRRNLLRTTAGALSLPFLPKIVWADNYPSKRVTLVVPFAAGGGLDTLARILGEGMRPLLGQPIVVENVGGADGTLGTGRVASAPPDGYAFVVGAWNTHVTNGAIYKLDYDLVKSFEPVALLPDAPMVLIAKKGIAANNLKEFITWAKTPGNKPTLGTAGAGSPPDLLGRLLGDKTGIQFSLAPYRGAGPAMQDVIAGHIDAMFINIAPALPHIKSGAVKAMGLTSQARMSIAPDIPTMEQAGLRDFHFSYWAALFAPKGTPKEIVDKVNKAVNQAMNDADARKKLEGMGFQIPTADRRSPAALATFQKAEIEKWWPVIKAAGVPTK